MRILHTSDWHLGKTLEGRSRQEEQEKFLEEMIALSEDQQADVVLIAGDIFDGVNPPAAAEELYYETLDRLAGGGKRAVVVIAGNHDHPDRLSAADSLATRNGITLSGLPGQLLRPSATAAAGRVWRMAAGHGWMKIQTPACSETAVIALLPYPSETRLNEVLAKSLEEDLLREAYANRIKRLFSELGSQFTPESVNIAVSHLYLRGGLESDSERPIQVGGAYTVDVESLPPGADYVALGHLHRPQNVKNSHTAVRYSGSPLAYSFSEAGYAKSVTLVEAFPGKRPVINELFLSSGYPLVRWQAKEGLNQVWRWLDEGKDPLAWIDLEICLTQPLSAQDVQHMRRQRERIVNIRPVFPETERLVQEARSKLPVDALFRHFYESKMGVAPEEELVRLFQELLHPEPSAETQNGEAEV